MMSRSVLNRVMSNDVIMHAKKEMKRGRKEREGIERVEPQISVWDTAVNMPNHNTAYHNELIANCDDGCHRERGR
ncbi:hypothetical protein TIFTF001_055289 [Ficus carica]|uniref:Uncharacterized protein n=1 Tax=Ficus carica TaxID=3494 RepID=A0AA88JFT7_FICCA|nr:hypothetical protein TIFTF001_055288 [Ficus carica]GMN72874.1 hypothetical protein TIFTF001_055289 [Ficus carica]